MMEKVPDIFFTLFLYGVTILFIVGLWRRSFSLYHAIKRKHRYSIIVEIILISILLLFSYWFFLSGDRYLNYIFW